MTYTRRIHGKHFMVYQGHWSAVLLYRLTGKRLPWLKHKLIYRG